MIKQTLERIKVDEHVRSDRSGLHADALVNLLLNMEPDFIDDIANECGDVMIDTEHD